MDATICECGKTCFAPTSQWCVAIVDAEDGWLLRKYKWTAHIRDRVTSPSVRCKTYAYETGKSALLHRRVSEIMCKQVSVSLPLIGDSHDDELDDYA